MLEQIAGNEEFKESLGAALRAGRLAHGLLFCAEEGCGAGFAARCLAADWLYPQGGAGAAQVMEGRAAECIELRPEGKTGGYLVDQVREARGQVFETALSAEGRVVIFHKAHRMNAPAANALLKVLEEPPPGVLFILTAPDAAAVLPTIRSRCALYFLSPVSRQVCEAYLKEHCPGCAEPGLLARICAGRIGAALAAAADPKAAQSLAQARALAAAAARGERYEALRLLAAFEKDKDKTGLESLLKNLTGLAAAALEGEAVGLDGERAARVARAAADAARRLTGSANRKLLLTTLALRLCAGAPKG